MYRVIIFEMIATLKRTHASCTESKIPQTKTRYIVTFRTFGVPIPASCLISNCDEKKYSLSWLFNSLYNSVFM